MVAEHGFSVELGIAGINFADIKSACSHEHVQVAEHKCNGFVRFGIEHFFERSSKSDAAYCKKNNQSRCEQKQNRKECQNQCFCKLCTVNSVQILLRTREADIGKVIILISILPVA